MPEASRTARPGTRTFKALVLAIFALGILLRVPTSAGRCCPTTRRSTPTTADALARGDLLYRDVVDHKPPLIYHVYQAGFAAFGPLQHAGAHALVILAVLLTAGFLFAIKRREATGATAGGAALAAAGLFLVFSTTWHDYDALAANCELFLLAPQAVAAWLLLRGLRGRRRAALRALATSSGGGRADRNVGAVQVPGPHVPRRVDRHAALVGDPRTRVRGRWAVTHGRSASWPARWCRPRSTCSWCAAAGNPAAAIYWFRFNFSYVGAGPDRLRGDGARAAPDGADRRRGAGALRAGPRGGRRRGARPWRASLRAPAGAARAASTPTCRRPSVVLGLLWLATSAVAVAAGGRFFGHYFHLVLAPLCLLAAPGVLPLVERGLVARAPLLVLCALPALFFFGLATVGRSARRGPGRARAAATTRSPRASPRSPRPTSASSSGETRRSSTCWRAGRWARASRSATT